MKQLESPSIVGTRGVRMSAAMNKKLVKNPKCSIDPRHPTVGSFYLTTSYPTAWPCRLLSRCVCTFCDMYFSLVIHHCTGFDEPFDGPTGQPLRAALQNLFLLTTHTIRMNDPHLRWVGSMAMPASVYTIVIRSTHCNLLWLEPYTQNREHCPWATASSPHCSLFPATVHS